MLLNSVYGKCPQVNTFVPFSLQDERCGTDDELSDDQKPFFEAWVANANDYFDESLTEEDYSDLHTNTNPSQPYSPFHYEEDWDAEVLQNENPYGKLY